MVSARIRNIQNNESTLFTISFSNTCYRMLDNFQINFSFAYTIYT